MGDSHSSVPRRTVLYLSIIGITSTSGCLNWLGLGGSDSEGENSGSEGENSGSDGDENDEGDTEQGNTDTTENGSESGSSNQSSQDTESDSDPEAVTNESQNESAPDGSRENEAAVPESEPQNDPSEMEVADPNESSGAPTQDDLRLEESSYSTRRNAAKIVVTNTSDYRIRSVDFWVTFYDEKKNPVGEGMNGATSVDPDQTVTVWVPCEAGHASTFTIDRVIIK